MNVIIELKNGKIIKGKVRDVVSFGKQKAYVLWNGWIIWESQIKKVEVVG